MFKGILRSKDARLKVNQLWKSLFNYSQIYPTMVIVCLKNIVKYRGTLSYTAHFRAVHLFYQDDTLRTSFELSVGFYWFLPQIPAHNFYFSTWSIWSWSNLRWTFGSRVFQTVNFQVERTLPAKITYDFFFAFLMSF